MQKKKAIVIAGINVTVSEVSVTRIYRLLQGEESVVNLPLPEAMEKVKALLPLALDVDLADLLKEDIFSADIDLLVSAFQETNPIFFKIARALNVESVLAGLTRTLVTRFSSTFAD